jgi:hypothetical protein
MKTIRWITLLAVIASALLLPVTALANNSILIPDKDDKVIFGGNFTLAAGEEVNGDLISFGGNLTLEKDSQVNGDLVSMGGNTNVSGTVTGDLVAMGGNLVLGETALIEGSLALLGASIDRASGAQVTGDVVTNSDSLNLNLPIGPEFPDFSNFDNDFDGDFFRGDRFVQRSGNGNVGNRLIGGLFFSFAMAAVAVLTVLFLPKHTRRVADAVLAQPIASGGLSLLTFAALPVLALFLSITVILIPVVLLLFFLTALALAFGWVAAGLEVGERLATSLKQDWAPPVQAAAGTFVLTFVVSLVGIVPCLGWLAGFIMLLISFGAVLLTRFGTQSYPQLEAVGPAPVSKAKPKAKKTTAKKKTK